MRRTFTVLHLIVVALLSALTVVAVDRLTARPALAEGARQPMEGVTLVGIAEGGLMVFVTPSGDIWVYGFNDPKPRRHYKLTSPGQPLVDLSAK